MFQPGRDDDLAFRFGQDPGVSAMHYLALALWPLGEVDRAVSLVAEAEARIAGVTHIGTRAYGKMFAAMFEVMRGDFSRAAPHAVEVVRLAREHDLQLWLALGSFSRVQLRLKMARPATGSRTCVAASNFCAKQKPSVITRSTASREVRKSTRRRIRPG